MRKIESQNQKSQIYHLYVRRQRLLKEMCDKVGCELKVNQFVEGDRDVLILYVGLNKVVDNSNHR
jgi:hypothetical protein